MRGCAGTKRNGVGSAQSHILDLALGKRIRSCGTDPNFSRQNTKVLIVGIYTRQTTSTPTLNSQFSARSLQLSWLLPSQDFVLQESSSLAPQQWTNSSVPVVLNLTNLHNEVIIPTQTLGMFYRLESK